MSGDFAGSRPVLCRVIISPDGTAEASIAVRDLGTGPRTVVAMVTAEEIGLPVETIKVNRGDTSWELIGPDSGGSMTALSIAPAGRAATGKKSL